MSVITADAAPIQFVLTADPALSRTFYADSLGLPLVAEDDFALTFALGGGATMRLTRVEGHVPGPHTVMGWRVTDLDAALDRMASAGISCEIFPGFGQDDRGVWTSPDGAARIVWFRDPEGNGLSLTQFG